MEIKETELKTFIEHFYEWERSRPDAPFLRQPYSHEWKTTTWSEAGQQARRIAAALKKLGLQPGDKVGTVSKNCYHWVIADLAIMMGGFVSTPFYPNLTGSQLKEVLVSSEAKVLFVGKLDEWENMKTGIPDAVQIIRFPHYAGNVDIIEGLAWDDLLEENEPLNDQPALGIKDLWTILFTSGTTGSPKGVMLDYYAPAALMVSERTNNQLKLFEGTEHRFFSYLPLNHIAERIIVEGAALWTGGVISFAESLDTFARNLRETQPTSFMAVPRIWTKFQMGILARMPEKRLNLLLSIPLVSALIKKKIQKGLGLDKAKIMLTGAAPTPDPLKNFFSRIGLKLQEVYAMTENCGGCTLMPINGIKPGTVGKPLGNVEIRINPDNGEVQARAPWNMLGYYRDPEKTAEVLRDGWIHTGDKGELTPDGYLRLTGRVTDTFKSAKGKYIVPGPIEWGFAKNSLIEQICVVGLAIPQPLALVVLSETGRDMPREEVRLSLQETLDEVNGGLPNYEWVKTVVVTREGWGIENGILTPTMKIRRDQINKLYEDHFLKWYEQPNPVVWEDEV